MHVRIREMVLEPAMFPENIGLGTVTLQVLGRLSIHGPVIFPLYELIIKA
jgi:hypothetical protein